MGLIDRKPRGFLATPMRGEFTTVREALAATLKDAGVEMLLVEELPSSRGPADLSRELLRKSDFVIADVTTANPNVIYEVGLAHGLGLPVLLLTQDLDSSPATLLQEYLFLVYNPSDLGPLRQR